LFIRKHILPWTAAACFKTDEAFYSWLQKKHRFYTNLRMIFLVLAAACLLPGYLLEQRPIMLLTAVPLALVLLVSMALEQIEKRLDGQNKSDKQGDESNNEVCL